MLTSSFPFNTVSVFREAMKNTSVSGSASASAKMATKYKVSLA